MFLLSATFNRTRIAFEVKLQKTSRSTDFRVPQSICTMFNVMVDAKAQSTKLCSMEMGQEVKLVVFNCLKRGGIPSHVRLVSETF